MYWRICVFLDGEAASFPLELRGRDGEKSLRFGEKYLINSANFFRISRRSASTKSNSAVWPVIIVIMKLLVGTNSID